jgi:hypothetical protein
MASTHIEITATASRLGAETRSLIDTARRVYADADKVKNVADEVSKGDDWPALALKWGCTAAEAQAAYGLLTAFATNVKLVEYRQFIKRLG